MTAATLLVLQVSLGYCDDYDNANARQCNCAYMWMRMNRMNGGLQVRGLGLWLLVGVGLTALLLSVDISSVNLRHNTIKNQ